MDDKVYLILIIVVISFSCIFSVMLAITYKKNLKKNIYLNIDENEMVYAENLLSNFLTSKNLNESYTVEMVAQILKIKCLGESESLYFSQASSSEPDIEGFRYFYFKKGLSAVQKRFVLAYECAHVIFEHSMRGTESAKHVKIFKEQIENYAAAALLMRYDKFYGCLQAKNYYKSKRVVRKKIIKDMCLIFGVSDELCIRRIYEVTCLKKHKEELILWKYE